MSFDLAVWYPQKRINDEEADGLYARLCENDTTSIVAHPAVDEFYAELIATHPEIDTVPEEKIGDFDYCPWSCRLDRSKGHVIMNCMFSKAEYVSELVENLARKDGLAVYDPQSGQVTYPDGTTGTPAASRVAMWTLGVVALLFSAIFLYSEHIDSSEFPIMFYVFAGLCMLMAIACFRQAIKRNRRKDTARAGRQEN